MTFPTVCLDKGFELFVKGALRRFPENKRIIYSHQGTFIVRERS